MAVSAGLAAVLGVAGGTLTWAALRDPGSPPAPPGPGSAHADVRSTSRPRPTQAAARPHPSAKPSPSRAQGGVADHIAGLTLAEARPVRLAIPRLHVRTPLVRLGVTDGAMDVPQDPAVAGWYTLGPSPGALGPAVIAGHVTWNRVPAVFYRLGTMRPGDRVAVVRSDGVKAVFSVTRVARYGKTRFPTKAVYGSIDHAGLRLITCAGKYDAVNHRYLDNVVVFANLVAAHPVPHRSR
jgi:sortase (surface protein transpeptidase)